MDLDYRQRYFPVRLLVSRFFATLMEYFQEPRNRSAMHSPDLVGIAGFPGQGRFLMCYLKVCGEQVVDASFTCHGCGVTIACGSALVEAAIGTTLAECQLIEPADLVRILDGIPADVADRAAFAVAALRDAISHRGETIG